MSDENKPLWLQRKEANISWDEMQARSAPVLAETTYKPKRGGSTYGGKPQGDYKKTINNFGYRLVSGFKEIVPKAPLDPMFLERLIIMSVAAVDRHALALLAPDVRLEYEAPVRVYGGVVTYYASTRWIPHYMASYAENLGVKLVFCETGVNARELHVIGREGPAGVFAIMAPTIYTSIRAYGRHSGGTQYATDWANRMAAWHYRLSQSDRFKTPRQRKGRMLLEAEYPVSNVMAKVFPDRKRGTRWDWTAVSSADLRKGG